MVDEEFQTFVEYDWYQEEIVLKELDMAKEVAKTKEKEGLKHRQKIITKVDAKMDFRNKEIKTFKIK